MTDADNPELIKVRPKGQVTLPQRLRESLGVQEGDYLVCEQEEDYIILHKAPVWKRASFNDGIWKLIGTAEDKEGKTDVSSEKHKYLGDKS
jgi:AbrB family looped-hinge helix DNA binding protein